MVRALILGLSGPDLTADEAAFLADARPWGVILFARNVDHGPGGAGRQPRLTGDLRAALGRDAPVLVDQEGGTVQRLRAPLARAWPDANAQAGGPRTAAIPPSGPSSHPPFGTESRCEPMPSAGAPASSPSR